MSSHPRRFFVNNFPDYQGLQTPVDSAAWKEKILALVNTIAENQSRSLHNCDGGLYVGLGGIAYAMYYLASCDEMLEHHQSLMKLAQEYLKLSIQYVQNPQVAGDLSQKSAFLLGNSGIHALAAAFYASTGKHEISKSHLNTFIEAGRHCQPVHFLRCGGDELLVGRAGYLCGGLWLQKKLGGEPVPAANLKLICESMIQSGKEYSRKTNSPAPLMYQYYKTEYLGAAHGVCGIYQMLLSVPGFLQGNQEAMQLVKQSVDWLLSLQQPNGNFPCATDELGRQARHESQELVHWCHGAPGTVYMLAKAYQVWGEEKYLQACLKCGDVVWTKGLLKKGPGICHGVAGSGYVFLLLYRLTKDPKHLYRAVKFAEFMFSPEFREARTPDCPYSLYEGMAGTLCFLVDLLHPEKAAFPFFDVF